MSVEIVITGPQGVRYLDETQLPLTLGTGAQAEIRVPGAASAEQVASISALDGRPFLQPNGRPPGLSLNGEALAAASWLKDGDVVGIDSVRVQIGLDGERWNFSVSYPAADYQTLPPEALEEVVDGGAAITPVARRGGDATAPVAKPAGSRRWRYVIGAVLVALLAVALFLFTARAVRIDVEPDLADIRIAGGLIKLRFGERFLMWPGDYRVLLKAEGYEDAREAITVTSEPSQDFSFRMARLPGRLVVRTEPEAPAELIIDGQPAGTITGDPIELPAGPHQVSVSAERYLPYSTEVEVEGLGKRQEFIAVLEPGWADVRIETVPEGASVRVGDEELGTTPATVPVMAGGRELQVQLEGFKIWRQLLRVDAGQQLELDPIELVPADGLLTVTSQPGGAAVSIDGRYRGSTPVEAELTPGRSYEVIVSKPGFSTEKQTVSLASRKGKTIRVELEPRVGDVVIRPVPNDAEVLVDGRSIGRGEQSLSLPARSTRVLVRREGYADYNDEITPKPGLPQVLEVRLLTEAEAVLAERPNVVTTSQGAQLRLVQPGELTMGAPRREQGRRPNESRRQVTLTRSFYIGLYEVTNTEFREFEPQHTSGAEKFRELGIGDHPVALVSWEQAVSFCNWLSDREGLPRAYEVQDGDFRLVSPPTIGYRLPTEAEWAWVARYNGGGRTLKYPWGDRMPPATASGNFADRSARGIVANVLASYDDGYPVSSPVGKYQASPLGLFDIGGNVAEWVHDLYTVYSGGSGDGADPVGPDKGQYHVIRGSSWRYSSISELRFAYRDFGDRGRLDVGFRLARYADEE